MVGLDATKEGVLRGFGDAVRLPCPCQAVPPSTAEGTFAIFQPSPSINTAWCCMCLCSMNK